MSVKEIIKKYWEYIVAFLVPVLIVLIHCFTRNSWLLGEGSILRGDANIQYVYIFEELWNKVHSGDISFFSWNAVGGFDFYLNALYYTVSPATIIILLLPKSYLEDALQVFMVLKWAGLSFSAVWFFMHTKFNQLKKYKRLVSLTLGLSYALSTFCVYVITFFNWLDTMILFPFLLLLIEKMVMERTWKKYYILLTIAICCNCYIAFPICIFLLLWFVLQLQTVSEIDKKVYGIFFGSSVLAAISSCMVLIPSVLNIGDRYISGKSADTYVSSLAEVPDMLITKFFAFGLSKNMAVEGFYYYMSIGMLVLCMMFCFVKMQRGIKYTKILIAAFVLGSICVGVLNYVWHGFTIPHGYNPRFGFIFIFMLLVLALDVIVYLEQLKVWNCFVVLGASIALFCYAFFSIESFDEVYVYFYTICLLVLYCIMLVLVTRKSIKKDSFIVIICALCIVELSWNAYYQFSQYDMIKPDEAKHTKESIELSDDIELENGERIVFTQATYNVGLRSNQSSVSGFVSGFNGRMGKLCSALGLDVIADAGVLYKGSVPLIDTIFNVGYGVGKYDVEFSNASVVGEGEELKVYKMNQLAGFGYMTDSSVTEWNIENGSSFEIQNQFVKCATDVENEDLFNVFIPDGLKCETAFGNVEPMKEVAERDAFAYKYTSLSEQDGCILTFVADKDMNLYFMLKNIVETTIGLMIDGEVVYRGSDKNAQCVLPIGNVKKGQEISVICVVENQIGKEIMITGQFAEFDEAMWQVVYDELSRNVYHVKEMKSDYVDGTIKVDEAGIMMTSVPGMDGFKVYVDGKEMTYESIGNALIGVPLEPGEHQVEFYYQTPYAMCGWLLSICGFGVFVVICLVGRKKNAAFFCETGATE